MAKKRILLVNQFCGFLCRDIAISLGKTFGSIRLFTGNPENFSFPTEVQCIKGTPYNRLSFPNRLKSWLLFSWECLFSKKIRENDIWVLVSNPPLIPLIMGYKAFKRNIPFFLVIYDLYPEALNQVKFLKPSSPLYKIWQRWNRKIFSKASGIITLSKSMKEAVQAYIPEKRFEKVTIIPNWYDETAFSSAIAEPESRTFQNSWEGKMVVLYSGNFGLTHDLETLVETARIVEKESSLVFILAGEGAKKIKLMELAKKHQLKNLEFLPFQSTPDFSSLLRRADIAVVSLGSGAESISVPSKTYNSMAAGLCLLGISGQDSALSEMIAYYTLGKNVLPGNAQTASEFLLYLTRDKTSLENYKLASRKASENFTSKNADFYSSFILSNCQ